MKKFSWVIFLFLSIDVIIIQEDLTVRLSRQESSISSSENPHARADFELLKVVNPITGEVPANIRKHEIEFSKRIPSREEARSGSGPAQDWKLAGPYNVGGRTRAVGIDVSDPTGNTIIAGGVSGGMWKTENGGATWKKTSNPEDRNSISTLAQDTRAGKENIWYFGTGELLGNSARVVGGAAYRGDGIFKSIDFGESWSQLASTKDAEPSAFASQFQYSWRIITDHSDLENDVVLAAVFGGILRSEDGGDTWQLVLGENLHNLPDGTNLNEVAAPFYTDVTQTPDGRFYGFLSPQMVQDNNYPNAGFFWSQDGITWHDITAGTIEDLAFDRVVIDANDDRAYFFGTVNNVNYLYRYNFSGVDMSGNPMGSWVNLTNNLPDLAGLGILNVQTGYNMSVKIHPTNPDMVFLGATNLYRSSDGFSTLDNIDWIGGYSPTGIYELHHPDQHDILFFPSNPSKALSANDGGLQICFDILGDDVRWTPINNGYVTSQFYTVSIPKYESSDAIVGGMQDNGTWMNTSGTENSSWTSILDGDGSYAASTPGQFFWYMSYQNGRTFQIALNNEQEITTFARVDPESAPSLTGSLYLFVNPFALDQVNPNIMYMSGGNAIWRNNNLSQLPRGTEETSDVNWEIILEAQVDQGLISTIEPTRNSEYLYFGTTSSGLFRLDNPSGQEIVGNDIWGDNFPELAYVSCVASNPEDPDEVIAILSNYGIPSIFHSSNAGETFTDIGGNLEEFPDGSGNGPSIRWMEIVPLVSGTRYYVGTSVGLYSTDLLNGNQTTWVKESTDKIGKSVVQMMDYRPLDGTLVVSTHGNGMFRTVVSDYKSIDPSPLKVKTKESKAYPNPFSSKVTIEFYTEKEEFGRVDILDLQGRFVGSILLGPMYPGKNSVTWNGTLTDGKPAKRGMYLYRIYYEGFTEGGRIFYNP